MRDRLGPEACKKIFAGQRRFLVGAALFGLNL